MARNFYIAPKIGSGTPGDPWRPKISGNPTGWVSSCNDTQCLVLVTGDTSGADTDTDVLGLVAENLDTTVASLGQATRNRIQNGLDAKHVPITLTDYTTVRDFLNGLGQFFDPNFLVENFFAFGATASA